MWACIISILAVTSVAIGTILHTLTVQHTVQIVGVELKLYETDDVTEVISVDWGQANHGDDLWKPGPSTWYNLTNIGEDDCYIYWTDTLNPAVGTLQIRKDAGGGGTEVIANGTQILSGESWDVRLRFQVDDGATRQSVEFDLIIYASDQASVGP